MREHPRAFVLGQWPVKIDRSGQPAGKDIMSSSETSTLLPRKINRTDIAYAAGIFDGEGHVGGTVHSHEKYPELRIGVTNTNRTLIRWFEETFGGWTQERSRPGNRTCYEWHPTGETTDWFLKLIVPFLKVKQQQARLALVYRTLTRRQSARERRLRIIEKIQRLNRGDDTVQLRK